MDLEPIYCAEQVTSNNSHDAWQVFCRCRLCHLVAKLQICVPPELSEVLKAYTKEVIRRQPEDLVEFSAYYFANLANILPETHALVPPSVPQVSALFRALSSTDVIRTCDV